jgi:hypothetical protein
VFSSVRDGSVGSCSGKDNLSRGRHECVFEDAERDGSCSGGACQCPLWHVLLRNGWLRRGQASHGNHLHGRRGCGFDAARWLESCRDGFVLHGAMRVWVMRVLLWKPPSCGHGGRSTRPWWDGLRRCKPRFGMFGCVLLRYGRFTSPHPCRHGSRSTREVWDRPRPCMAWRVGVRSGGALQGALSQGTKLVQARCRINAGGLG